MRLWQHCLHHEVQNKEDNSGFLSNLRGVFRFTAGVSNVLPMVWVLTILSGQIRLKLMTPLVPSYIAILKCMCCAQYGCFVFPLSACELQGQQGLGFPFLLSPSSCCHLHAAVNVKKEKKVKKSEDRNEMAHVPSYSGQNSDSSARLKTPLKYLFERKMYEIKGQREENSHLGNMKRKAMFVRPDDN